MAIEKSEKPIQGKANWGARKGAAKGIFYYFRLLLLALVLALFIKQSLVEAYRIPSESMEDTLLVGDFLLANKAIYGARIPFTNYRLPSWSEPAIGDVIVFRYPEDQSKSFIKRIVARGGDTVEIVNKVVMVNGRKLSEDRYAKHFDSIIIPKGSGQQRDNYGPERIPSGQFFVLGDNRDNSSDSRYWGCVPRDLIMGKAFLIHWSWENQEGGPRIELSNPLSFLTYIAYHVRHLPSQIRWSRLFSVIG